MKRRILGFSILVLILLMLIGAASPAPAVAQPEFATIDSARMAVLYSFDGVPLRVCQEEIADYNHWSGRCVDVATATLPNGYRYRSGESVEFVYYGGSYYARRNVDRCWTVWANPHYIPRACFSDALLATPAIQGAHEVKVIGPAEVDHQAVTQIQFWASGAEVRAQLGGQAVTDLFVTEDGVIVKEVNSVRSAAGNFVHTLVLSDINEPIEVYAPHRAEVCPTR